MNKLYIYIELYLFKVVKKQVKLIFILATE